MYNATVQIVYFYLINEIVNVSASNLFFMNAISTLLLPITTVWQVPLIIRHHWNPQHLMTAMQHQHLHIQRLVPQKKNPCNVHKVWWSNSIHWIIFFVQCQYRLSMTESFNYKPILQMIGTTLATGICDAWLFYSEL